MTQLARTYRGQPYQLVETVPHRRRDGTLTTLSQWASICAQCGAPFMTTTPTEAEAFKPNRRCQKHKRPGQRVQGTLL